MNNDNLANVLSAIGNNERVRKKQMTTQCTSTVVSRVLEVLKQEGYVEGYEVVADGKAGTTNITLTSSINGIGAVKPRFSVPANGFTKFEKRYLPAQGFGVLIVSTPKGIMTHTDAKKQNTGGKLLAYCY